MFAKPIESTGQENEQSCHAFCTSCGCYSEFVKAGVQRWPPRVVAMMGLPESIQLWHCTECNSTLSETDLLF